MSVSKQVLQQRPKENLKRDFFPERGVQCTPMSNEAKQVNVRATSKPIAFVSVRKRVQCELCHMYVIAVHVHCNGGSLLKYANRARNTRASSKICS